MFYTMDEHLLLEADKAQIIIIHEIHTVFLPWILRVILGSFIVPSEVDKAARDSIHMNYPSLSQEQKADLKRAVELGTYENMDVTLLVKLIR